MSVPWNEAPYLPPVKLTPWGIWRAVRRGVPLAVLTFGCLGILLLVRLIERPVFGLHRPVTPYITQFVCRNAFRVLGMRFATEGTPMPHTGAAVANHSSWLDIFALNAPQRIYFVSKAEVASWPGIGWLARATGTVFIERRRTEAARQKAIFEERLVAGHHLMFFPEGTSTDGRTVAPFKPTLLAAFFDEAQAHDRFIQPISVIYHAPADEPDRFYGWWGDMSFEEGLLRVLAVQRPGGVTIVFHDPVRVAGFTDRKSLAKALEDTVRSRVPQPREA